MIKGRFKVLCAVFLITLGLAFRSYGFSSCREFYNGVVYIVESLDAEYKRISNSGDEGSKRASQITVLLNRSFFPMVEKLSSDVNNLTVNRITSELSKAKIGGKIGTAGFGKFLGSFDFPEVRDTAARSMFFQNSDSTKRYRLRERQDVVAFKKLIFVDPNKLRVRQLGNVHEAFSSFVTPIGEYGPRFSEKMLRTTQVLTYLAEQNLSGLSAEIFSKNSEMLSIEAARVKRANSERAAPGLTPLSSFIEGILSFHQLVMIILAEKIPGLPTGEEALKAFIFSNSDRLGLTTALTSRIPMALVGPMTNAGLGFKNSLRINEVGQLEITDQLKATLIELMDMQVSGGRRRARCPMAGLFAGRSNPHQHQTDKAGLQKLAEAYWKVFVTVSSMEDKRTGQTKRIEELRLRKEAQVISTY